MRLLLSSEAVSFVIVLMGVVVVMDRLVLVFVWLFMRIPMVVSVRVVMMVVMIMLS